MSSTQGMMSTHQGFSSPRPNTAQYVFGDDTTTLTAPSIYTITPSPSQPVYQDTASFTVQGTATALNIEVTASHFSSGDRANNLNRFKEIARAKADNATLSQVVMGDINTEVKTPEALQALADETGMVVIIPSLKIRKLRGLQDQLHKRMDQKDDYDSMFVAVDPCLVDAHRLGEVANQNYAWPANPARSAWKTFTAEDVAQAWMDDRVLTDHGVVVCPIQGGQAISLANAARANYEKYNIQNEARVDRRTYLEGQQIVETCVANAVIAFIADFPESATLSAETKTDILDALIAYRDALAPTYQAAYDAWDDKDDLCSSATPLGQAVKALGDNAGTFVKITSGLSWEDIHAAREGRETLKQTLTDALVEQLGVGRTEGGPLAGNPTFVEAAFRATCKAKIDAAWDRVIKRQSGGDLYKLWFAEVLQGQTTGGMPIPAAIIRQNTRTYIETRQRDLGLEQTICVMVEALR